MRKKFLFHFLIPAFLVMVFLSCMRDKKQVKVMIFSRLNETGQHQAAGLESVLQLAAAQNLVIGYSSDAQALSQELDEYDAIIFWGRFADHLSQQQQQHFQDYIGSGGGFMGVQAELSDPKAWPWYAAMFAAAAEEPFRKVNLAGGGPGKDGAAALFRNQEYGGGRVSLLKSPLEPTQQRPADFQDHFLSGLHFVLGEGRQAGSEAGAGERFYRRVLQKDLKDGVKLVLADNGTVYYIERAGKIFKMETGPEGAGAISQVGEVPVSTVSGAGLLGLALDPKFADNNLIYLFYTPQQPKSLHQKVSRFALKSGSLDPASEKVLLTIPYDYREDGHTGGALLFDDKGNLYISTGDNTDPHQAQGFGPLDERPGRNIYDAQRTAGNTASLLGKILRIRPQPDGSYTIPEGNLFDGKNSKERPEIYVMGCRNPYTMSYDTRTGFLYWGEVGPDAGRDSTRGSRGYDEINQVRKAGYYGWPYFIGQNKAYAAYDFATKKIGVLFDPAAPVNKSVNNTGSTLLPPAQPAFIAYPYAPSSQFPVLGEGTRCAIAGPVYHYDPDLASAIKFPAEYDNVLFIADWSRKWLMTVHLDEQGNYVRTEPFMPLTAFNGPIDLKFGPDGALYLIEYGEPWGMFKTYGTLVRIEYNGGNRPPLARASASDTVGATPLTVTFSDRGSTDPDGDAVKMEWTLDGKPLEDKGQGPAFTFTKPGQYLALLTVTDAHGRSSQDWIRIQAGNARPQVRIATPANQTFYWDNSLFAYQVKVQDPEDGSPEPAKVQVSLHYLPEGKDVAALFINSQQLQRLSAGNGSVLMDNSDCKTCHTLDKPALGPSLQQIARRYPADKATVEKLARKVLQGGGGVWGSFAMAAHPQLSQKQAADMVRFILSLDQQRQAAASLPLEGQLVMNQHAGRGTDGLYILTASYTDQGSTMAAPLSAAYQLRLRHPRVEAVDFRYGPGVDKVAAGKGALLASPARAGAYVSLKGIDLRQVDQLAYQLTPGRAKGFIEVRQGSPAGPVLSRLDILPAPDARQTQTLTAPLRDPGGKNDLFFVFGGELKTKGNAPQLQAVTFNQKQQLLAKR